MTSTASFSFPTSVQYGPGVLSAIESVFEKLKIQHPLIVCDTFLPDTPAYGKLMKALEGVDHLRHVSVFKDVHPDPVESNVRGAADAYRTNQCDGIIGLGGGSALDVAKVCRLLIMEPGLRFEESGAILARTWSALPPFIAIPTTAGTGSEVGRSSVITLEKTDAKSVIFHPSLLADEVLLDPEVTVSLPDKLTAATGLDALTHCIESFTSPVLQPLCDGIALEGIQLISRHFLKAVHEGSNLDARGGMLLGAMMGGIAFQKDLGATHSMAHPLSNLCQLHHGLANALCLPFVMQWNAGKQPGLYRRVGIAAGLDILNVEATEADTMTLHWVRMLIEQSGIQMGLSNHGVTPSHIEDLADLAIQDSCHQTNPVPVNRDVFVKLYQAAL
jgi:alcohol dehydrogenase class IV